MVAIARHSSCENKTDRGAIGDFRGKDCFRQPFCLGNGAAISSGDVSLLAFGLVIGAVRQGMGSLRAGLVHMTPL